MHDKCRLNCGRSGYFDYVKLNPLNRFTEAAREWENAGRQPEFLYSGVRLAVAREWAEANAIELTALESSFLAASLEAETRRNAREPLFAQRRGE